MSKGQDGLLSPTFRTLNLNIKRHTFHLKKLIIKSDDDSNLKSKLEYLLIGD